MLAARRHAELQKVCEQVERLGATRAIPLVTDVTKRDEVDRLRDVALDTFGRVDVWVNNAGRGITRRVLDLTDDDFDYMMTVNVKSALYGMQSIVPQFMRQGEGHVINVSSFLGRVPLATFRSAYNAAKAALNALTTNLRMDLGATHPNIHVSLVMPGIVLTGFADNALGADMVGAPRPSSAMRAQSVEAAVAPILELIEHPRAELYTNPASKGLLLKYYEDVEAFEKGRAASA